MANATTNKKPAPAAKPTPAKPANGRATAAPPKPADDLDDDDDLDADTASTDGKRGGSDFSKLPPAKRVAVRIGNEVTRLSKQAESIANWPAESTEGTKVYDAKGWVASALELLKRSAEALASLPDDYKPRVAKASSKGGGSRELKAGDRIRITDKRMPEYEGVLEPNMMRGIEVVEIRGNKVIARTPDGMKAMFARGHVCLDDQPAA